MSKTTNLSGLTGLRGVAAVWVLLFHVQSFAEDLSLPAEVWLLRNGFMGVDLFFMLSGFVLMHAHQKDFTSFRLSTVFEFLRLRFFRVYPLSTAVLLLIVPTVLLTPGFVEWYRSVHQPPDYTLIPFVKTLFLATRWFPPINGDWNQPVWSLSVEILAYVAFPFLAFVLARVRSISLLSAVGLVFMIAPIAILFAMGTQNGNNINILALVRVAGFFTVGVVLCKVYQVVDVSKSTADILATLSLAAIFIAASIGAVWSMIPAFAALIMGLSVQGCQASNLLSTPIAEFLGQISFPLYLVHLTPLLLLRYAVIQNGLAPAPTWVALAAVLALTGVIALVLHNVVENPSHQWAKRRFPMTRSKAGAETDLQVTAAETARS